MRILVTGSNGMLGKSVSKHFKKKNYKVILANRKNFDLSNNKYLNYLNKKENKIDYIIHCAAYTNVNESEKEEKHIYKINISSLEKICKFCQKTNTTLIYPQTFMVLKSKKKYHLDNSIDYEPIGVYAHSKMKAEKIIKKNLSPKLYKIIRLGGFFGGGKNIDKNFVGIFLNKILPNAIKNNEKVIGIGDRVWQPTYTDDIAMAIEICLSSRKNYFQYASSKEVSFYRLANNILKIIGERKIKIKKISNKKIIEQAERPQKVIIKSSDLFIKKKLNYSYLPRLKKYLNSYWD